MNQYGCIGKQLTHSFSKEIHAQLADYEYALIELTEEQVPLFLKEKAFRGLNVTMPYKQAVMPYLDEISENAARIGAVNTIVNRDGMLYGYNTDYDGLLALIRRMDLSLQGKKVLVLGTGGTSRTATVVATDLGAAEVLCVSRQSKDGSITYEEAIGHHTDADVMINTTPCGMYPHGDARPIDVAHFPQLEGVVDVVYNPLRTRLVLDAKERGLKAQGGLYMLVMQAVSAAEKFLDTTIGQDVADRVFAAILAKKENIVLIGMPGSGKTTVGKQLREKGYPFVDTDDEIERRCGCSIKELITRQGESYFRDAESAVIRDIAAKGGCVIATGGGAILRKENVQRLQQNGCLFFLDVPLSRLCATEDRPLSATPDQLAKLYTERETIYRAVADVAVPAMTTPDAVADDIVAKRMERLW